jgi:hypothetical protein
MSGKGQGKGSRTEEDFILNTANTLIYHHFDVQHDFAPLVALLKELFSFLPLMERLPVCAGLKLVST